mgnify:FL=1
MRTLEERERIAYANGDVQLARLLAEALDGNQDLLDEAHQDGYEAGYKEGYVAACAEK